MSKEKPKELTAEEHESRIAANVGIAATLPALEKALTDYEKLGLTGHDAELQLASHRGSVEVARKAAAVVKESQAALKKGE